VNYALPSTRPFRAVDKGVVTEFINNSPLLLVQDARQYLEDKYPGLGFPGNWEVNKQGPLDLLDRYGDLGRVWYGECYSKHPTNPRLRAHRDNPPHGNPVSVEEALETIRRIHLGELVAAGLEPDQQPEDFDPDASLALPSVQVRPLPTPPPANAQVRALPIPDQAPIPRITPQVQAEPIMPTTFPSEIKIKNIVKFKRDPQQLSTLDISIYDLCDGNNDPAYYGGTVIGSMSTEYIYCSSDTVGSADNYTFGRRFGSKVVSEFEGDAKLWWEDYIQGGGNRPNCWKLAVLNEGEGSKPDRIVELSLFDLLLAEFPAENDQQAANVELKRYRWNPLKKDAKPFATFKSHTNSLAKRAGYSNWALEAREIEVGCNNVY
jgi:hypothetical protein